MDVPLQFLPSPHHLTTRRTFSLKHLASRPPKPANPAVQWAERVFLCSQGGRKLFFFQGLKLSSRDEGTRLTPRHTLVGLTRRCPSETTKQLCGLSHLHFSRIPVQALSEPLTNSCGILFETCMLPPALQKHAWEKLQSSPKSTGGFPLILMRAEDCGVSPQWGRFFLFWFQNCLAQTVWKDVKKTINNILN